VNHCYILNGHSIDAQIIFIAECQLHLEAVQEQLGWSMGLLVSGVPTALIFCVWRLPRLDGAWNSLHKPVLYDYRDNLT
jgi:hypothetical protein